MEEGGQEKEKRRRVRYERGERKKSEHCQRETVRGVKKDISMLVGEPGRRPWRAVFARKCKRVKRQGRATTTGQERKKLNREKKERKECKNGGRQG